jgi:hypothetical protein
VLMLILWPFSGGGPCSTWDDASSSRCSAARRPRGYGRRASRAAVVLDDIYGDTPPKDARRARTLVIVGVARFHEAVSEILQFLGDDLLAGCQFDQDQSERRASTGCSSDAFQAG